MHKTLLLLSALLGVQAAQAQIYGSVLVGQSHANIDCADYRSCTKNGAGLKLVGGYRLNESFSLEAGYINFAAFKGRYDTASVDVKPSAFTLGGAAVSQLDSRWALTARLGYALVRTSVSTSVQGVSESRASRHSKAYAGLGMIYTATDKLRYQLSVDTTRADDGTRRASFRLVGVGAIYDF